MHIKQIILIAILIISIVSFSGCTDTSVGNNKKLGDNEKETFEKVLIDVFSETKNAQGESSSFSYLWLHFEDKSNCLIKKYNGENNIIPLYFLAKENIGNKIRVVMEKDNNCVWFEVLEKGGQP